MSLSTTMRVLAPVVLLTLGAGAQAQTAPSGGPNMTFFVTSTGSGKGAGSGRSRRRRPALPDSGRRGWCWHKAVARLSEYPRSRCCECP
jgi:hypothetical protein